MGKEEKNPSGYIHKPRAVNSAFAQPKKNHSMEQHNRDRNRRAAHAKRQRDLAAAAAAYGAAFDKSTKELAIEDAIGQRNNAIHDAKRYKAQRDAATAKAGRIRQDARTKHDAKMERLRRNECQPKKGRRNGGSRTGTSWYNWGDDGRDAGKKYDARNGRCYQV